MIFALLPDGAAPVVWSRNNILLCNVSRSRVFLDIHLVAEETWLVEFFGSRLNNALASLSGATFRNARLGTAS
jgi:hypothetical protein